MVPHHINEFAVVGAGVTVDQMNTSCNYITSSADQNGLLYVDGPAIQMDVNLRSDGLQLSLLGTL